MYAHIPLLSMCFYRTVTGKFIGTARSNYCLKVTELSLNYSKTLIYWHTSVVLMAFCDRGVYYDGVVFGNLVMYIIFVHRICPLIWKLT